MPSKDTMRNAYSWQKSAAKSRGIPWEFTFEMWVAWWLQNLGPRWSEMRGRKRGQYVMARIGDKGPYNPTNVTCATCTGNHKQKTGIVVMRYKQRKGKKLNTEQVLDIYTSTQNLHALSRAYGVARSTIRDIKRAVTWRHVTQLQGAN